MGDECKPGKTLSKINSDKYYKGIPCKILNSMISDTGLSGPGLDILSREHDKNQILCILIDYCIEFNIGSPSTIDNIESFIVKEYIQPKVPCVWCRTLISPGDMGLFRSLVCSRCYHRGTNLNISNENDCTKK